MQNLILVLFFLMIVTMLTVFIISFVSRLKKKPIKKPITPKEIDNAVNGVGSDSNLSTNEIIKKFHIFMGYPFHATGLNRRSRRIIRNNYKKFLWNWHLLDSDKQDVKKICAYLSTGTVNNYVFSRYRHEKK